jgi:hypothetical protein
MVAKMRRKVVVLVVAMSIAFAMFQSGDLLNPRVRRC